MQKQKRSWNTLDINLAAYLQFRGIPIELENSHGRVIFCAPPSDELYRLTSAFNQNDIVPVADFVGALRTLKARMFALKSSSAAVDHAR